MYFNSQISNKKKAVPSAVLIVLAALCSLGLAFVGNPIVAAVLVALTSAFLIVTAERKPATVLLLFGLISFFFNEEGISLVALLLSMVVGCSALAKAFDKLRSPLLWGIPVVAFVISAIVTGDLLISSVSLGFLLPAAALVITFKKKYARVGAICLISGAYMIFFAAFVLADIYVATGGISLSVFEEGAEYYRQSFADVIMQLELMDVTTEMTTPIFTPMQAQNLANEIVSLFPAFFVIFCNAMAYFSQKNMYALVRRDGDESRFEDKMIAIILSPFAGATFLISFFVMLFSSTSSDHALVCTVAENIFYIFIPGLAMSGIMFQIAKIARFRRGIWVVVIFVILTFFNAGAALLLAACTGAYYSIAAPVYEFLNSKKDNDSF